MAPVKLISLVLAGIVFMVAFRVFQSVLGPVIASWRLGPKVEERPVAAVPGWGDAFDLVGDCGFKGAGATLRIEVPGTLHDLSVEQGKVSAPRVLRVVEGDFEAEVNVVGELQPGGERTSTYALPYHGAGLLVWLDRDNFIRFERAAILRGNSFFHYVNFEQRSNASMTSSTGTAAPEGPIRLRLERQGTTVKASYRAEGQEWVRIRGSAATRWWGESLRVGVAAVNTASVPLVAEFKDLHVEPPAH